MTVLKAKHKIRPNSTTSKANSDLHIAYAYQAKQSLFICETYNSKKDDTSHWYSGNTSKP